MDRILEELTRGTIMESSQLAVTLIVTAITIVWIPLFLLKRIFKKNK